MPRPAPAPSPRRPARRHRPRPPLRPVGAPDAGAEGRARQRDYVETFLRATTNRNGRPYADRAVATYLEAVTSLEGWLAATGFAEDYSAIDTATLNAYLRWCRSTHTQGGTNTKSRNLATLFAWLAEEYGTPNPYDGSLVRYAPTDPRENVTVLPEEFIDAMLRVTGGRDYEAVRDHAIIRLLLTGVRREELAWLRVEDLDMRQRVLAVVGKGERPRVVAFGHKAALALQRWLRIRMTNRLVLAEDAGPLWMGTRNRGALRGNGIYGIVRRRAVQAGYPKEAVHPHMFRHTRADQYLRDGGAEGDLMRQMGWRDRAMLDRYAAHLADARALEDAHRRALDDRY